MLSACIVSIFGLWEKRSLINTDYFLESIAPLSSKFNCRCSVPYVYGTAYCTSSLFALVDYTYVNAWDAYDGSDHILTMFAI